jgi:hypothetical protein
LSGAITGMKRGEFNWSYTPEPNPNGYSAKTCMLVIHMYVEGSSYGLIAWAWRVHPQSCVLTHCLRLTFPKPSISS